MPATTTLTSAPPERVPDPDAALLERLRAADPRAFPALVERYGPLMLRIALTHVRTHAVAEEVVQEAWLGVLEGLHRFEGRSSLKTWVLRILVNRARTRGTREARCVPFSALTSADDDASAVPPERLQGATGRQAGGGDAFPRDWELVPEDRLLGRETLAHVGAAIRALPARQQQVIVLRDVQGWRAEDVCDALALSDGNQRVLLHRARSRVRAELEADLALAA
jgi:RNA polymerase sigma-70 factor (ECF subfamily)